jgi:hypothetical protein
MRDKGSKENPVVANSWVICPCGEKHKLIPAIDTPVYWCGDKLLELKAGDNLEIEENENN